MRWVFPVLLCIDVVDQRFVEFSVFDVVPIGPLLLKTGR